MIRLIQFLLRSKRVRRWLISRALKKPFVHLEGYMSRYWLFNERWRIPLLPAIRIHCIHRRDGDRDIHDHPFDFRSFILFGSYVEQDVMGHQKLVKQGDTYYSPAERFHIIVHVKPSDVIYPAGGIGVWTLVILSRKRQPWGFLTWVNGEIRKIHHKDYPSKNEYTMEEGHSVISKEPIRYVPGYHSQYESQNRYVAEYKHVQVWADEKGFHREEVEPGQIIPVGEPSVVEVRSAQSAVQEALAVLHRRCEPGTHLLDDVDDEGEVVCSKCGVSSTLLSAQLNGGF